MIFGVEGPPGAGKTSLCQALSKLEGVQVVPEMLVDPQESMNFTDADYAKHDMRKHEIAGRLGSAGICLMDRCGLSWYAYNYANGRSTYLSSPDAPEPDFYIYLRVSADTSLSRRGGHSQRWKGEPFALRLIDYYDSYFASLPVSRYTVINAELPQPEVIKIAEAVLAARAS